MGGDPLDLGWRGDPVALIVAAEFDLEAFADRTRGLVPAWHRRAACAGQPIETFFPERGRSNATALELCAACPVRRACLAEALADPSLDHGIRGGATAQARKLMRNARRNTFAATAAVPGDTSARHGAGVHDLRAPAPGLDMTGEP